MKNLGWVLPLLLLAACAEAPPSRQALLAPPPFPGFAQGIDLPNDSRDVSNELKGAQLDFVARYYRDPASRWPTLSPAEAQALSAAGMKVVAVWESHSATPAYFSYASGYSDGMSAYRQARAVGQPAGSAIYFAVDYNAYAQDITGPIDRYFRGVAAGLIAAAGRMPEYKIGVYGSGAVCYYLKHAHLAEYAWLSNSTSWAGYIEFGGWDIRQAGRSPGLSFDQDQNEARGEYGGFRVGSQFSSL